MTLASRLMTALQGEADVIVVGAGLAGLVASAELADAGRRVIVVDQEPEQSMGGQAFWSLGGLFLVDSPEQRRMGIRDSYDLAFEDWMGTARFDRIEDHWPRKWAEAYLAFAAGEKRAWLSAQSVRWFPVVGWAERGGYGAIGHGNSVPRFHVTWGTGPGVLEPFVRRVRAAAERGLIALKFRHRVNELAVTNGAVEGVAGDILEPSPIERGQPSSRAVVGEFSFRARAVIVTSGGIGANHDLVRRNSIDDLDLAIREALAQERVLDLEACVLRARRLEQFRERVEGKGQPGGFFEVTSVGRADALVDSGQVLIAQPLGLRPGGRQASHREFAGLAAMEKQDAEQPGAGRNRVAIPLAPRR